LQLNTVSDKQKTFKLIADYIELVVSCGGNIVAESGEGRLKTPAAYTQMDDEVLNVYTQIRDAFDPFGTLNPGVKQKTDLKTLVAMLDPDYNLANFAKHSPQD
ncbi:MAG: FAD-linked oxidase C-terminal domain-containing protein, partial [Candidatus Saccharibacteria bacterium]